MTYEPLNRRLAIIAAIFAFLGVLLGGIALGTNYWSITSDVEQIRNEKMVLEQREHGRFWNVCIVFLISMKTIGWMLLSSSKLSFILFAFSLLY